MKLNEKWDWVDTSSESYNNALDSILNTEENLFIFGPGGTGKSVLLRIAFDCFPNSLVLAPTGVASANLVSEGVPALTIHAGLKLPPIPTFEGRAIDTEVLKLFKSTSVIFIDEVSMINASLMDYILKIILKIGRRRKPPRIILFGDLFQLPPVVDTRDTYVREHFKEKYKSRYFFFNAKNYRYLNIKTINLEDIHRQKNLEFKQALNNIRLGLPTQEDFDMINQRVVDKKEFLNDNKIMMYLATTNAVVNKLNKEYSNRPEFKNKITYYAYIEGRFDISKNHNLEPEINLSVGQQVMCTYNNYKEGYQNGTMGIVKRIYPERVVIENRDGRLINVVRDKVVKYDLAIDNRTKKLRYIKVGSFEQISCKPAFAVTIHKSQSLTLDTLYLDLESNYIPDAGVYLALSRSTSLEGIGLSRKIKESDIKINSEALEFFAENMKEEE